MGFRYFLQLEQLEYVKGMMVEIPFFSLAGNIVESHGGMSSMALWYPNLVGFSAPTEGSVFTGSALVSVSNSGVKVV